MQVAFVSQPTIREGGGAHLYSRKAKNQGTSSKVQAPNKHQALSGHEHNCGDVRCAEFGLGQGARREHIPKWICDRRATPPQAKFGATLRAAVLFRPDFVARSSQTPVGYARRSRLVWPKNPSPRTSS